MNAVSPNLSHTPQSASALVVSGFLGAGKTTLVRHLLENAQQTGVRVGVISNEFGDLGIDLALLGSQADQNYVELSGGCVCCKLSDELLNTLQQVWERARPHRVIVETSGVALPFDTVLNFWREPVSQWVEDCVAVVVVNAEQLAEEREITGTFEQQVSSADLLVLNKLDLVSSNKIKSLEARLGELAPGTPILHAEHGLIDPNVVFPVSPTVRKNNRDACDGSHEDHTHEAFQAEEIMVESGLSPAVVIDRIKSRPALRAKGFVQTSEGIRLLQGVGPRIDLIVPPVSPPSHLLGRVVLIRRSNEAGISH